MLRYRADVRTLGVLLTYAATVVTLWQLNPTGVWAFLGVVLTCVLSWLCAVIAHNTVHCPLFLRRWQNRLFQVWVTCSYGFPISEYVPGHNLSHHRYTQEREDVMRTTKVRFGWNLLNGLFFFFAVAPGVTIGNYRYKALMKEKLPQWNEQLTIEILSTWGIKLVCFALDWRKALLFVLIPHLFAVWGITSVNYVQHDGCDMHHPVNHSRNFVGRLFNWVTLNNGYHGMHHMQPSLHWSLLPAAHAEKLAPTIHPNLDQKSLAVYLFKTFIYPGKRVTFDGKPVVIEGEGPDHDWVKATESAPTDQLGAAAV